MNPTDLAFSPALEQARLIRTKEISPRELTQVYLDRIAQFNPQLGSYFTVTAELATADAKAKTEQLTTLDESELPPFFGVPISIKDLNPVPESLVAMELPPCAAKYPPTMMGSSLT